MASRYAPTSCFTGGIRLGRRLVREPAQTQTQDGSGCTTFWLFAHAQGLIPRRDLGLPVVRVKIARELWSPPGCLAAHVFGETVQHLHHTEQKPVAQSRQVTCPRSQSRWTAELASAAQLAPSTAPWTSRGAPSLGQVPIIQKLHASPHLSGSQQPYFLDCLLHFPVSSLSLGEGWDWALPT